jgi:hypothetical protein
MIDLSLNICRPGFNATCSLCCGSHNYKLTHDECDQLFRLRSTRIRNGFFVNESGNVPEVVSGAMQCKYVGYTDRENNEIGCLIHESETKMSPFRKDFFRNVCSTFYCKGRDVLTKKEILFAAELTGDWFYYPILITEIKYLRKLVNQYENPCKIPEEEKKKIKKDLLDILNYHNTIDS